MWSVYPNNTYLDSVFVITLTARRGIQKFCAVGLNLSFLLSKYLLFPSRILYIFDLQNLFFAFRPQNINSSDTKTN